MPVGEQVAAIFAVTEGHVDKVAVSHIRKWERGFIAHLKAHKASVLEGIRTEKQLTDTIKADLVAAIADFNEAFAAENAASA